MTHDKRFQVIDLLNIGTNNKPLQVRWSKKKRGFFVENLFEIECAELDDLLAVLEEGEAVAVIVMGKIVIVAIREGVVMVMREEGEVVMRSSNDGGDYICVGVHLFYLFLKLKTVNGSK